MVYRWTPYEHRKKKYPKKPKEKPLSNNVDISQFFIDIDRSLEVEGANACTRPDDRPKPG